MALQLLGCVCVYVLSCMCVCVCDMFHIDFIM